MENAADGGGAVLRAADVEVRIAPDAGVRRHDVDGPVLPVDDNLVLDRTVRGLPQPRHLDGSILALAVAVLVGPTVADPAARGHREALVLGVDLEIELGAREDRVPEEQAALAARGSGLVGH